MPQSAKVKEATEVLIKAVKFDQEKKYAEALPCYREGIGKLRSALEAAQGPERVGLQKNLTQYEARIETIKAVLQAQKTENKHKLIAIANDAVGYDFEVLFGEYLGPGVTHVTVRDPYIRQKHQVACFIVLLELLRSKCQFLRSVKLITGYQDKEQGARLDELKSNLASHNVGLVVEYSDTLHDRDVQLNTGWVFKMGRGLDMFKKQASQNALGLFDFKFRKCYETEISIFHESNLTQS